MEIDPAFDTLGKYLEVEGGLLEFSYQHCVSCQPCSHEKREGEGLGIYCHI